MVTIVSDIYAVVPAAGLGSRMRAKCPKQYLRIGEKTILEHSVTALLAHQSINNVVVVISPNDTYFATLSIAKHPQVTVVNGGVKRIDSILAGIKAANNAEWILVHDAARPCLQLDDLVRILAIKEDNNGNNVGGVLVTPVRDTIKQIDSNKNSIVRTIDRSDLWHALTPQFFPRNLLYNCLLHVLKLGINVTDEASVLEYCGFYPKLIRGRIDNIKVTYPEDLQLAKLYLTSKIYQKDSIMRIGYGFDVHIFGGNGPIIIGGISIPYKKGLLAHSDGDVLLHALSDALLGAAALGDIGNFFPDTDLKFKGINSRHLLCKVWQLVQTKGYMLGNIDVTIIAQAPKMMHYIPQMRILIAEDLRCNIDDINIKATTTETLRLTNCGEGIACNVVALLCKI